MLYLIINFYFYEYFLLVAVLKQVCYFRLNTFEGSFCFTSLRALKHQIDLRINGGNGKTEKIFLFVYPSLERTERKYPL